MGRTRNHKSRATKNKSYSKRHATCNRRRDIDQIQDDLKGKINSIAYHSCLLVYSLTRLLIYLLNRILTHILTHLLLLTYSLTHYEGIDSGKDMTFSIENSEDLPGLGQYYCVQCARHFADDATLQGCIPSFTLTYSLFTHPFTLSLTYSLAHLLTRSLIGHKLSKLHKRRLKDLQQPQYSKEEAERAAGQDLYLTHSPTYLLIR